MTRLLPAAALALCAAPALAQRPATGRDIQRRILTLHSDEARAVIGVTTSSGVSAHDTLGLIVTAITPNGPADRAGLEEGDRLQSVDGTSLRLSASDTGDFEMRGIMQRRLVRELQKVQPGQDVELTVYAAGRTRSVRVKSVAADSLYPEERSLTSLATFRSFADDSDRASLGISIGATGSRRDTLGVFVFAVDDSGPAAAAGLQEGSRIAAVNGVDLRVASPDAGDDMVGNAKVRRLQREVERLKPGDEVTLRVYQDGQIRTIRMKAARASALGRWRREFFMTGDVLPPLPPMPVAPLPPMPRMQLDIDGPAIRDRIQRSMDRAMQGFDRAMRELRTSSRN